VTNCGDGFFLDGGVGEGSMAGSEGNRIWSNDLSYSANNGIETFASSSYIYDNRIFECDRGISGTNSYNTIIANNKFRKDSVAIAIENGRQVQVEGNIFQGDLEAIRLSGSQFNQVGQRYSEDRKMRSAGYVIHLNSFNQNPLAFNFSNTDSIRIYNNRYSFVDSIFRIDSTVTNIDSFVVESVDTAMGFPFVKDPVNPFKGSAKFAGRDKIMVTEWGPYDFNYPIIWNSNPADTSALMKFNILGPKGIWKIVSSRGIEISGNKSDSLPSKLGGRVIGNRSDVEIILEFRGSAFTDQFGNRIPANRIYRFGFRGLSFD
jgi:hypothetical protein